MKILWIILRTVFFEVIPNLFLKYGMTVVHGIESKIVGISLGPRYNFVQPGWKWIPFLECDVGVGFTDSKGVTLIDRPRPYGGRGWARAEL